MHHDRKSFALTSHLAGDLHALGISANLTSLFVHYNQISGTLIQFPASLESFTSDVNRISGHAIAFDAVQPDLDFAAGTIKTDLLIVRRAQAHANNLQFLTLGNNVISGTFLTVTESMTLLVRNRNTTAFIMSAVRVGG